MGLMTSAIMCQHITSGMIHMMEEEGCGCENYLDDFIGVEHPESVRQAFHFLAKVLEDLALVEKDIKIIPPDTVVDCLGILFMVRAEVPSREKIR